MHKDHGQRTQSQREILAFKLEVCDTMYFVGPAAGLLRKGFPMALSILPSLIQPDLLDGQLDQTQHTCRRKENLCKTHQSVSSACSPKCVQSSHSTGLSTLCLNACYRGPWRAKLCRARGTALRALKGPNHHNKSVVGPLFLAKFYGSERDAPKW